LTVCWNSARTVNRHRFRSGNESKRLSIHLILI
jgi:hypothetical protein